MLSVSASSLSLPASTWIEKGELAPYAGNLRTKAELDEDVALMVQCQSNIKLLLNCKAELSEERARNIVKNEEEMEYPSVAAECRVIAENTRTVIIDPCLAESIRNGRRVSKAELLRYSVQMWANRIDRLGLEPLFPGRADQGDGTLYVWTDAYDPDFLGYMVGVLRNKRFLAEGGAVI